MRSGRDARSSYRRVPRRAGGPIPGLLFGLLLAASACGGDAPARTLVVHAPLPDALLYEAERAFEAVNPTVDVRVVAATAGETLAALREAGGSVDVWWGAEGTALATAAAADLLQPYRPAWAQFGGAGAGDAQDRWQAWLVSPFVIAFNREEVTLTRAPSDWVDLFHFRWAGDVAVVDPARDPDAAYFVAAMLVESLRREEGLVAGFDWLRRLDAAVEAYAVDPAEVVRRLGRGRDLVAILPRHVAEQARHDGAPWMHYRIPESGTPLLVRGIAIAADAAERDLARRFVDLAGAADLVTAARLQTRWTAVPGAEVDASRLPPGFELEMPWTPHLPAADTIAAEGAGWIERWSREVRGLGNG